MRVVEVNLSPIHLWNHGWRGPRPSSNLACCWRQRRPRIAEVPPDDSISFIDRTNNLAVSSGARVFATSAASEQDDLRATARAFFAKHSDEPAVRSVMMTTDGYDPDLWRLMADQLGLQALLIPSVYGGGDL